MNLRQTVIENDLRILDVATYVATKGSTIDVKSIAAKDPDKLYEFQDKVMTLFKEYKSRIRKNCFTLAELEEREYSRYGITEEVPVKPAGGLDALLGGLTNGSKKLDGLGDSKSDDIEGQNKIGF